MKLFRAIPAIAAVALLGACSPTGATASVVNGDALSEKRVTEMAKGCAAALGVQESDLPRRSIVQTITLGRALSPLIEGFDSMSDADIIQAGQSMGTDLSGLLANKDCNEMARATVLVSAVLQNGGQQALQTLSAADIDVNPKYGRWDPTDPNLFSKTGSLSIVAGATLK